jgi:hypothetical protein
MTTYQPRARIRFAQKEVSRFHEDIEDCKVENDDLAIDRGLAGDLVARTNFLFGWIMLLDNSIHIAVLEGLAPDNLTLLAEQTLREWLAVCLLLSAKIDQLEKEQGPIEGAAEVRSRIREAQGIFTRDEDFFHHDKLIELRDRAIDEHRAGQSEELVQHEQPPA